MPAQVIASLLRSDINDRTQLQAYNSNPAGTFINGVSSVPNYLYQSLSTLWFGASGQGSLFQNVVVSDLATGEASPAGSIVVTSQKLQEQVFDYMSQMSDRAGAEVTPVYIYIYKPRAGSTNINPIQNIGLRIRYILDNTLRALQGLSGSLPPYYVSQDNSIDPTQQFWAFYQANTESVKAPEATLLFNCDYIRMFSR